MAKQILPVATGTSINSGQQVYMKTITLTAVGANAVLVLKNAAGTTLETLAALNGTTVIKNYTETHTSGHYVEGSTADLTGAGAFASLEY